MKFEGVHIFDYDATFRGDVTIEGNLTISNSVSQTISFGDNDSLYFGDGNDLQIVHDGANSKIENSTGQLTILNTSDDKDIIFRTDDGSGGVTDYIRIDGGDTNIKVSKPMQFGNSVRAYFGGSNNSEIMHNGTDMSISNFGGDLKIINYADDKDIIFQSDDGSGGVETYFFLDGNAGGANPTTIFPDDSRLAIGSGQDLKLYHSSGISYIDIANGNLTFRQTTDDGDIIFQCDDGSGGLTNYFVVDGSDEKINFQQDTKHSDSVRARFGNSSDFQIYHNGTNTIMTNGTGEFRIIQSKSDANLVLQCDDGSGGETAYITLDGSLGHTIANKEINFGDSIEATFGTSNDLRIYHDGSNSYVNDSGTGVLVIASSQTNMQIGGANKMIVGTNDITVLDDIKLAVGTGGDLQLYHDGTDNHIEATSTLNIGTANSGVAINIGHTTSETTINDNLTVTGDLTVNGTTVTVDTTNLNVQDKNITLNYSSGDSSSTADGAGITIQDAVDSSTDATILWDATNDEFDFSHKATFAGAITATDYRATDTLYLTSDGDNSGSNPIVFRHGSGGERMRLTSDGKLGIGTTPSQKLHVNGNVLIENNNELRWKDSGATERTILELTSADDLYFGGSFSGSMIFVGGGSYTERMRIDDSGNLQFPDNALIKIGAEGDMQLTHDASNSHLINYTGDLKITNNANDKDIIFNCDDGSGGNTAYLTIDGSATNMKVAKDMRFNDNVDAEFGTSGDFKIYHDGSNTYLEQINAGTGNIVISNANDDADIIFKSDDGSGGVTEYFRLDGSSTQTIFSKNQQHADNVKTFYGNAGDLSIYHDGSNSYILANGDTGNLVIQNSLDDTDIIFKCDDGSGGTTPYITLDGSAVETVFSKAGRFADNVKARFGNGGDMYLQHDGTDSFIVNTNGDLTISNQADDKDIIFSSDDGSGGVTTYLTLDGSDPSLVIAKKTILGDNVPLYIGSNIDIRILHDGSDSYIQSNGTGHLYIQQYNNDKDIIFWNDDGSGGNAEYLRIDGGAETTIFSKPLRVSDSVAIEVGTGADLQLSHNGTNSSIVNYVGDLNITNGTDDGDITFSSDDGSGGTTEYFRLDGGDVRTIASKPFRLVDSIAAEFGTGLDMQMYHSGGEGTLENITGNLRIIQNADDGDIQFKCDDGSGGNTTYITIDGGAVFTKFHKQTVHIDSVKAEFGSGGDLAIQHDGTNSLIDNYTGDMYIRQNADDGDILFRCDDGSGGLATYFSLDGGLGYTFVYKNFRFNDSVNAEFGGAGDMKLYHDASNSFITNGTGDLYIINGANDKDIIFQCDDGSGGLETYFYLDGSASSGDPYTVWPDNSIAAWGTDVDLRIQHDGSTASIFNTTGHLQIINYADDKDIIFKSDDGSGGVETYFYLDGSFGSDPYTIFPDSSVLAFGTGGDLRLYHDGSHNYIKTNGTGNLYIMQQNTDGDISFQSDDGSGGDTEYFRLDGSSENVLFSKLIKLSDNVELRVGDGNDIKMFSDGTDGYISGETGDLYIRQRGDDKDIIFQSDDGSGGLATYLQLDGSAAKVLVNKPTIFYDTIEMASYLYHNGDTDTYVGYSGADTFVVNTGGSNRLTVNNSSLTVSHKIVVPEADDITFTNGTNDQYVMLSGETKINAMPFPLDFHDLLSFGANYTITQEISTDGTNFSSMTLENGVFDLKADNSVTVIDGSLSTEEQATRYFFTNVAWASAQFLKISFTYSSPSPDVTVTVHTCTDADFESGSGTTTQRHTSTVTGASSKVVYFYLDGHGGDTHMRVTLDKGNNTDNKNVKVSSIQLLTRRHGDQGQGPEYNVPYNWDYDRNIELYGNLDLSDNKKLNVGNANDLQIFHDASNSYIYHGGTGNLYIKNETNDQDVVLQCDDGSGGVTAYITLDGSAGFTVADKKFRHKDNVEASFGSSDDMMIKHDGTDGFIQEYTGNLYIRTNANDKDVIFQSDDGSGGVETYFYLDGSLGSDPYTIFPDSSNLALGTGYDLRLYHDGSNSYVRNTTGNLIIQAATTDGDLILQSDDGSGGETAYITLDGSNAFTQIHKDFYFLDSVKSYFGSDGDSYIRHTGSNFDIINSTGNINITNNTDDGDIVLSSDDGSGGTTAYLTIDGSATSVNFMKSTYRPDNIYSYYGNNYDLRIHHDGTDSKIHNDTGHLKIEIDADDKDLQIWADDQSGGLAEYFRVDGSLGVNRFLRDVRYNDSVKAKFGTGDDLQIYHDATNSIITNATGDLYIENGTDDKDILFRCDNGSGGLETYFYLDGSNNFSQSLKHIRFVDNASVLVGSGSDLSITHNGTNSIIANNGGDLQINQNTNDGDLIFQCDDGSGGTTEYFKLDGGAAAMVASKSIYMADNKRFYAGGGGDLAIYHDGSNTNIENITGNLNFYQKVDDQDIIFLCDDGSGGNATYFQLDGSEELNRFYKNVLHQDDVKGMYGTGLDLQIYHNGTNSYIDNATGDLYIRNLADDEAIIFQCDDGSGGVETYFQLEGISGGASPFTVFPDNSVVAFGSSHDLRIYHSGTSTFMTNYVGNFYIDQNLDDGDIIFRCDDGSGNTTAYLTLDGSAKEVVTSVPTSIPTRKLGKSGTTDGDYDGDVVYFGGTTSMEVGKIYYLNSSGNWALTDADAEATAKGMLAVALGSASDTNGMLVRGFVTLDHDPGTVGDTLFLSTTAGQASSTAPSGNGDIVRVVGYCLDSSNGQVYFNPDGTFVEVSA